MSFSYACETTNQYFKLTEYNNKAMRAMRFVYLYLQGYTVTKVTFNLPIFLICKKEKEFFFGFFSLHIISINFIRLIQNQKRKSQVFQWKNKFYRIPEFCTYEFIRKITQIILLFFILYSSLEVFFCTSLISIYTDLIH